MFRASRVVGTVKRNLSSTPLIWRDSFIGSLTRRLCRSLRVEISCLPDDELLWRAICKKEQYDFVKRKPKRSFFRDKKGLSLDLARFSTRELTMEGYCLSHPFHPSSGLAEMPVAALNEADGDVRHKPVLEPDEDHYCHCQLAGFISSSEALDRLCDIARVPVEPGNDLP
jgi:hypothetical protein